MENGYIPYKLIVNYLPVKSGEVILIASDLTRLAMQSRKNEGGFDVGVFIQSIQNKLTREGTLLIPSYNHDLRTGDAFDILKTMPVTGTLATAALHRGDFSRTRHPLHSFLTWGNYADFYSGLENKSSFGPGSPFAFFLNHKVKMLCISVGVADALTYVHYLEEKEQIKYRKYKNLNISYTDDQGIAENRQYSIYAKKPGWINDFHLLEQKMISENIISSQKINRIRFQLVSISDIHNLIFDEIRLNHSRNLAYFSWKLFLKNRLKEYLYKIQGYRTTSDKIKHALYLL